MKSEFLIKSAASCLSGKKVLLGISGSIAAFKAIDLIRLLKDAGAETQVILTEGGKRFVSELTLETLTGRPVLSGLWGSERPQAVSGTHHITTARWADAFIVMPASAGVLSRLAHGAASDLLSTEFLAFRGPVLVVPAMNPVMFHHPATQANLNQLKEWGIKQVGPEVGVTACGEEGEGRMAEASEVLLSLIEALRPTLPHSKRILLTVGGTESMLDPVRRISNRSSGKMGAALAWEAYLMGHEVIVVCGNTAAEVIFPKGVRVVRAADPHTMYIEALANWSEKVDAFIGVAAVLDVEAEERSSAKIKKEKLKELRLKPTADIVAEVSRRKKDGQIVVGFAAETENHLKNAQKKLIEKNCDFIFVNDVAGTEVGFEGDQNEGWIIQKRAVNEPFQVSKSSKQRCAQILLSQLWPN